MLANYVIKVSNVLGGFRGQWEVELVKKCFAARLSPLQAATVVLNSR